MAIINSVLGPLDTADLGFTLSHEHVIVGSAGFPFTFPDFVDRQATLERAVHDLSQAQGEGVNTYVDVTTHDAGRDIRLLEEVSQRSGVNIIVCTGTWLDIPRLFWGVDPDRIAKLYVREIEEGIEGTGIKAGIIKVANDAGGVTTEGETVLRAAARALNHTSVPIITHTWAGERIGDQQVRIFQDERCGHEPGLHRPQQRLYRPLSSPYLLGEGVYNRPPLVSTTLIRGRGRAEDLPPA